MIGGGLVIFSMAFSQHIVDLPQHIADEGAVVEDVKVGLAYSEGPAVDLEGNVYFSEFTNPHKIWKITPEGDESVFRENSNGSNGLDMDMDGLLIAAESGKVTRTETDGSVTTLVEDVNGSSIGEVNDLSVAPNGAMYFTNFNGGSIFFLNTDGEVTEFPDFNKPNGIEWFWEKEILYLAANGENKLVKYNVNQDGSFDNGVEIADVSVPDGITLDEEGNVYVASYGDHAVYVYDSSGAYQGSIVVDADNVSNCVFGGPDNTTLYMTGDGGLRKVELKIPGRKIWNVTGTVNSHLLDELEINHSFLQGKGGSYLIVEVPLLSSYEIELYDLLGNPVKVYKCSKPKYEIPIDHLPRGLCFLKVKGPGFERVTKVMVP
jgi:gluconolactonase